MYVVIIEGTSLCMWLYYRVLHYICGYHRGYIIVYVVVIEGTSLCM